VPPPLKAVIRMKSARKMRVNFGLARFFDSSPAGALQTKAAAITRLRRPFLAPPSSGRSRSREEVSLPHSHETILRSDEAAIVPPRQRPETDPSYLEWDNKGDMS
jgi:hypothetical protein